MKILWQPEQHLAQCVQCKAVYDITGINFTDYMNGLWDRARLDCEACGARTRYYQPLKPILDLISSHCEHCGMAIGEQDLYCGQCGAPK